MSFLWALKTCKKFFFHSFNLVVIFLVFFCLLIFSSCRHKLLYYLIFDIIQYLIPEQSSSCSHPSKQVHSEFLQTPLSLQSASLQHPRTKQVYVKAKYRSGNYNNHFHNDWYLPEQSSVVQQLSHSHCPFKLQSPCALQCWSLAHSNSVVI